MQFALRDNDIANWSMPEAEINQREKILTQHVTNVSGNRSIFTTPLLEILHFLQRL